MSMPGHRYPGTVGHLVLVGMMGSGKTTVGTELARRIGCPFVDVDEQIELRQGRSIPQIFDEDGEGAFRLIERSVLAQVLACQEPSVVAVGGGAVLDSANRELMRDRGTVIWLRATPEVLCHRVGDGVGRPLLECAGGEVGSRIEELAAAREAAYHQAAHDVVNVDHLTVDEVSDLLVRFLQTEPT